MVRRSCESEWQYIPLCEKHRAIALGGDRSHGVAERGVLKSPCAHSRPRIVRGTGRARSAIKMLKRINVKKSGYPCAELNDCLNFIDNQRMRPRIPCCRKRNMSLPYPSDWCTCPCCSWHSGKGKLVMVRERVAKVTGSAYPCVTTTD